MNRKKYEIYCRFSALAKKVVKASSLDEAKQVAESDVSVQFDEIIRLIEPCKVEKIFAQKMNETIEHCEHFEYKNWGAE